MGRKVTASEGHGAGKSLAAFAHAILAAARQAIDTPSNADAIAVHDFRKAMKRWRALMRLLQPFIGEETRRWRIEARDLARALAEARDHQAALDGLADLAKVTDSTPVFSARSFETIRARIENLRQTAETTALNDALRGQLRATLSGAAEAVDGWPLHDMRLRDVSRGLARGYGRARAALPDAWQQADAEDLHALRQRVVAHRYQMELAEPLWPRLGRLWIAEAQRLRERLGACQDLTVLEGLTGPHQPIAPWRSRLAPLIASRRANHVATAERLAGRLFAEKPGAFRRRLQTLWETRSQASG